MSTLRNVSPVASSARRVAFVTCDEWRVLWQDDVVAVEALTRRGHMVDVVVWDDPAIDWNSYDVVVLRETWDYYVKHDAFVRWIDELERIGAPLWNPPATLRWNLDKIYLEELERAGVAITPTVFARGRDLLADICQEKGWDEIVLKPRISAAGHRTIRTHARDAAAHQAELSDLNSHGGALVQPYLPEIEQTGEWSFIFIDGRYSHAALKKPAQGEFRVQFQYGGTSDTGDPGPDLISQAERVVRAVPLPWMYARVDGCVVDGRLLLMELEMIEPSLFLLQDASSPDRFAAAIEARLR